MNIKGKKLGLPHAIFISLVFGLALGIWAPSIALQLKPLRTLFLHGIKCMIAPLLFASLVTGINSAQSFKELGRLGVRSLIYFEIVTTIALVVGLAMVNLIKPGLGLSLPLDQRSVVPVGSSVTLSGFIEHLLPTNFAEAIVKGDVLQIVIFSTLFGMATLAVGSKGKAVVEFCESLAQVMFKFTAYILYLAPLGVGASIAVSVAEHGLSVLIPLFKLVGTLYLALLIFVFGVLYPICRSFKIPFLKLFKTMKEPLVLAFATTSSESGYPMALERLEAFGVPRKIASFVLPLGYSFNLDGSTLYLSLATVFVAQASGIQLSITQQVLILLTLMLTTKGVAAVPRASMVVLSGTLTAFWLPLEGVILILGVDEFMDMARTAVNLFGNAVATTVMARLEGVKFKDG